MGDMVLKISQPGVNVLTAQDKDMTLLSTVESHKFIFLGFVNDPSGEFIHNLGKSPVVFAFLEDGNNTKRFSFYKGIKVDESKVYYDPNALATGKRLYLCIAQEGV